MDERSARKWEMALAPFAAATIVLITGYSTVAAKEPNYGFKGEYYLSRNPYDDAVCQPFTRNLNQFRKLDFDACHPRLSAKYPEFTRPAWDEIPFDLAIAEKLIKSAGSYGFSQIGHPTAEEIERVAEQYWQKWQRLTAAVVKSGKARMWRLQADIDGDGADDILIRMVPGDRHLAALETSFKPLNQWQCDYNQGDIYVLEAQNPAVKGQFNSALRGTDLIHFAGDEHYYLLQWLFSASGGRGWDVPEIGATRSVLVQRLYEGKSPAHISGPVSHCFIDWVPTGCYTPACRPTHRKLPKSSSR